MDIFLIGIITYLMGSIPFGFILTKIFLKKDIRKIGSGNIGATNALRTGNKTIGYSTLVLDVLKAIAPIIYIKVFYQDFLYVASLCAFLGHVFPIWLNFKGGKGVATYLGTLIALSVQLSLLFVFTWIIIALIFRYSSVSSIFSSLTVFVINLLRQVFIDAGVVSNLNYIDSKVLFIFLILIIFTHKKNISNLKNKVETKIKL